MLAHTGIYISIKMKKTSCAGKVMVSEYHMHKHKGGKSLIHWKRMGVDSKRCDCKAGRRQVVKDTACLGRGF